jgi:hypothetical protein
MKEEAEEFCRQFSLINVQFVYVKTHLYGCIAFLEHLGGHCHVGLRLLIDASALWVNRELG